MIALAATAPRALWYLTRGTGVVTLILLTLSVALGVANVRRAQTVRWPRFVFEAVHRSSSLLAVAFLVVHIVTALVDSFAPIRVVDAIVPFLSVYRPLWLGLGAVASDLLIAVALTSVLRRRLGRGAWRATHWLAYACWPIAVLHGLGTGSDTKTTWMLILTGACSLVVVAAVWVRATSGWPEHLRARSSAIGASILAPLALIVWLPTGPLAAGWAKRAGTPSSLLPNATSSITAAAAAPNASAAGQRSAGPAGFSAKVTGTVRERPDDEGRAEVHLLLTAAGQHLSRLSIRIYGRPRASGGVAMTSSAVALGSRSQPELYRGTVTALNGANIQATVTSANGSLILLTQLQVDSNTRTANGTLNATDQSTQAGGSP